MLCLASLLPVAPAYANDDDYELAGALTERGWFDLARELYQKIATSGSGDRKAEGTFGLIRLKIREARAEPDSKKKIERFDEALLELTAFIQANRSHPRRADALSDLGDLRQEKGRWLLLQTKTDPNAAEKAEKEFEAAEQLFQDQIDELAKNPVPPPADPEKEKRQQAAYEEWEYKMMSAKYNKGIAMFSHAEAYRENPDTHYKKCADSDRNKPNHPKSHCAMRRTLTEMIDFFNKDFMWQYEYYLEAYDAYIHVGRGCQLLAEYSDRAEAEKWWAQCFSSIGKAKGLLTDPRAKKLDSARSLAVMAYYWEIKARLSYGDGKKGPAAVGEYRKAAKLAEDLFKLYAAVKEQKMGRAIQLEQAKAYCKAGELKKGVELLMRLKTECKGTQIEDFAIDILGEYAGEDNFQFAIDSADNYFSRGEAWFYKAMLKYRNALRSIKTEDEKKKWTAYCWHQIALCYYHLDRYYEAAAVCSVIVFDRSPWLDNEYGKKLAVLRLVALDKIAKRTKDSADQRALDEYNRWATTQPQIRDLLGDGPAYNAAAGLETKAAGLWDKREYGEALKAYLEAVKLWEQLAAKPSSNYREVSIFSIGWDLFNGGAILLEEVRRAEKSMSDAEKTRKTKEAMGHWDAAIKRFEEHLALVEKSAKDAAVSKRALGSVLHICKILVHPAKNLPEKALGVSEGIERRFPNAELKFLISIFTMRLEAKLRLDDKGQAWCPECKTPVKPEAGSCPKCKKATRSFLDEAEDDLRVLQAKYEKEGAGRQNYLNALVLVAQKLEQRAYDLRGENATLAKEYMIRAATYWYTFFTTNTEPLKGDQIEAIAEKLFFGAEERLDYAEKEPDDSKRQKAMIQAKEMFGKARNLFEQFLAEFGSTLNADRAKAIRRMITRANVKAGDYKKAIDSLLEVIGTERVEDSRQGSLWEDLADCYFAQARSMALGNDQIELTKKADNIYATLASKRMAANVIDDHTYRLLAKHAAALWFYDPQRLDKYLTAMDKRGYGRRYACEKCRKTIPVLDLKGATGCIYDRCGYCGESYRRGSAKECASCKGPVQTCDNTALLEVAWDDRLRYECAPLYACGHWRCGNVLKEYRFQCKCGFAANFERPDPAERDCPKCSAKAGLTLAAFQRYRCSNCGCAVGLEKHGGPVQDCPTHYRCGKCGRGYLKNVPATCPCGGSLAEHGCGAKGSLVPLCTRCENLAEIRRSRCAKCRESWLPRNLKDRTKCPKDGGELSETFEPLVRLGCNARVAAQFLDDLRRMKCAVCEKAFGVTPELEKTGSCPNKECPAGGRGRLRDLVQCEKCLAFGTVMQVRYWTAGDWQGAKQCDELESWRALAVKRIPDQQDRVSPPPGSRHVHPQTLKSEEQLTGGSK